MSRDIAIDALRIAGAATVILIHVASTGQPAPLGDAFGLALAALRQACAFAVPLFLFLSGYCLKDIRPGQARGFLRRRALAIYGPYLAPCLVYMALGARGAPMPGAGTLLAQFAFGMAWVHLWFVPLILQLYLLTPVIQPLLRRFGRAALAVALALQAAWITYLAVAGHSAGSSWHASFAASGLFPFMLGAYLARYPLPQGAGRLAARLALPLLLASGGLAVQAERLEALGRQPGPLLAGAGTLASMAFAMAVLLAAWERLDDLRGYLAGHGRLSRLVAAHRLGTYHVYLWHVLFILAFAKAYTRFAPPTAAFAAAYYPLCLGFALPASFGLAWALERLARRSAPPPAAGHPHR